MASPQSIEQDAFCSIIPKLSNELQLDRSKTLATKLFSSGLLSANKWKHILSSEGGDTSQKANDLLVALQTEIEADNSKVNKLIEILKGLSEYQAIGKQLEERLCQLKYRSMLEDSHTTEFETSHVGIQSLQNSMIESFPIPSTPKSSRSLSFDGQSLASFTRSPSILISPMLSKSPTKVHLVFAGNVAVGKSSITRRFVEEAFDERTVITTIGTGLYKTTRVIDERAVTVTITDTAGSERFRSVFPSVYKRAVGAFLVFDITNKESFTNLPQWFTDLKQEMPEGSIIVLLANKCDLKSQVTDDEIGNFAERNGLKYFKTSAKTGEGISDALDYCVKECLSVIDHGLRNIRSSTDEVLLRPTRPIIKRKTGCRRC